MKNYVQKGTASYETAPGGGWLSGQLVAVGRAVGVVGANVTAGQVGAVHWEGQFILNKDTGVAWAAGDLLYFNAAGTGPQPGTGSCNKTSGTQVVGIAVKAALAGDTSGEVRLNGAWTI
jgi:predicted RecA/RadA family phage recombinase